MHESTCVSEEQCVCKGALADCIEAVDPPNSFLYCGGGGVHPLDVNEQNHTYTLQSPLDESREAEASCAHRFPSVSRGVLKEQLPLLLLGSRIPPLQRTIKKEKKTRDEKGKPAQIWVFSHSKTRAVLNTR